MWPVGSDTNRWVGVDVQLQAVHPSQAGDATAAGSRRALTPRPGTALAAVCAGFLGWWVLGLSAAVFLVAGVVMAIELAHRRRIFVPKGFGFWLLFLLWVAVGVLVLNVDAPGAVPGDSKSRYLTWAYRLSWYLAATVGMLYVGNLRRELPLVRISRILAWMFLSTAVGGWLGILVPHFEFKSVIEQLLPAGALGSDFVRFLVHPQIVQLYAGAATDTPRPSAPFPYSNIWGLNFASFLPFFVHAWMGKDAGWRRYLAPVVLLLALVPAVQSLNRGLWAALIAGALVVMVRSVMAGRVRALGVGVLAASVLAVALVASPLGGLVTHRLANPTSNDTRTSLGVATVKSVVEGSPVVGFGTTRDVQGTFTSIAGGSTSECPQCSPPALGTQGHAWLVVFSQGLVGALLYLSFYVRALWRVRRIPSTEVTVGIAAISAHLTTLFVYDSIGMSMVAVGVGVAYLWREEVRHNPTAQEATLGAYLGLVRRHWRPVTACVALGLAIAAGIQLRQDRAASGTVSLWLPAEPTYLADRSLDTSMDTEGALAHSGAVLAAMSGRVGAPVTVDDVFVSADPNSRILNLRYVGPGAPLTADALDAAAEVVLKQRRERIAAAGLRVETAIAARRAELVTAYLAANRVVTDITLLKPASAQQQLPDLRQQRAALRNQIQAADDELARIQFTAGDAGRVVTPPRPTRHRDGWTIGMTAGGMLGLLAGLFLAYRRDLAGPSAGDGRAIRRLASAPVIWRGDPGSAESGLPAAVRPYGAATFLAADDSRRSAYLARHLSREALSKGSPARDPATSEGPTILVLDERFPARRAGLAAARLRSSGHDVAGVLVTGASR